MVVSCATEWPCQLTGGHFVMGFSAFLAKLLVEVSAVTRSQSVTYLENAEPTSGVLEQRSLRCHCKILSCIYLIHK